MGGFTRYNNNENYNKVNKFLKSGGITSKDIIARKFEKRKSNNPQPNKENNIDINQKSIIVEDNNMENKKDNITLNNDSSHNKVIEEKNIENNNKIKGSERKYKWEIILGISIYNLALLTSAYHTFKFYSYFEDQVFIAVFITLALEIAIFYFSYMYTKYKYTIMKWGLYIFALYIWIINYFIMEKNFNEKIIIFDAVDISKYIPLIASLFIPLISIFASITTSKAMVDNGDSK